MKFNKIIGILISFLVSISFFSSCGINTVNAVVSADGKIFSSAHCRIFQYFMLLSSEEGLPENKDDYLNKKMSGNTKTQLMLMKEKVIEFSKMYLVNEKMFDDRKLSFNEEENKKVDEDLESFWKQNEKGMQKINVKKDELKSIVAFKHKREKIFDSYYGENGEKEIKKEEWAKFYEENFLKFEYLYRSLSKPQEVNEDNKSDDPKTSKLSEEEIKQIRSDFESYVRKIKKNETTMDDIHKELVSKDEKNKQLYFTDPGDEDKPAFYYSKIFSKDFLEASKKYEINKAEIFKNDKIIAIVMKKDINVDDKFNNKEERSKISSSIKGEEFEGIIEDAKSKMNFLENGEEANKNGPGSVYDAVYEIKKEAVPPSLDPPNGENNDIDEINEKPENENPKENNPSN